jgi:hypothetical protein
MELRGSVSRKDYEVGLCLPVPRRAVRLQSGSSIALSLHGAHKILGVIWKTVKCLTNCSDR